MVEAMVHDWRESNLAERIAQSSVIAFDLDNTLACSRKPMVPEIASVLSKLINIMPVAIITGGSLELVKSQVIDVLKNNTCRTHLHIMPTNGTSYYRIDSDGILRCVYEHKIDETRAKYVISVMRDCAKNMGLLKTPGDSNLWGEQIEYRGSQITFSALGQLAPLESKKAWDPTGKLQSELTAMVAEALPDFAVRAGGETSVDVVSRGDNKAEALNSLAQSFEVDICSITFIGDRMTPEGNDYPTCLTGALAVKVSNPSDTLELCKKVLAFL